MYNLIELTLYDGRSWYLMPSTMVELGNMGDYTAITLATGRGLSVKESPQEIQKRIDQSRLINSDFLSDAPDHKSIDAITDAELTVLEFEFLGKGDQYANFDTFWHSFLSQTPDVTEVTRLLNTLQNMGYQLEETNV